MKKVVILVFLLLMPVVYAQEGTEDEAGPIGPEHGILHAFDIVADNIVAFLSRIGGEETYANTVRRIVAERRAEHLRLLRLKSTGEISANTFSRAASNLNRELGRQEEQLQKVEQRAQERASKGRGKPQ